MKFFHRSNSFNRVFLLLIIPGLIPIIFINLRFNYLSPASSALPLNTTSKTVISTHPIKYYDEKTFFSGTKWALLHPQKITPIISGGIVPHHLLPGFILSDFFSRLSAQNPPAVILIGPNHFEKGNHNILTSAYDWDTPFGLVKPDNEQIQNLINRKTAYIDENVLSEDHAVSGLMPYIRYYLPNTNVIPILLSSHTTTDEIESLSQALYSITLEKSAVLIAAVDFSHGLSFPEASKRDKKTLEVIQSKDYRQLSSLNNEYIDSPLSIITLMKIMDKLGYKTLAVYQHDNSGNLTGNTFSPTTSYYSIAFY